MFKQRELSLKQKTDVAILKTYFENLWEQVERTAMGPREKALVKTKLEEASMWANKGISLREDSDGCA